MSSRRGIPLVRIAPIVALGAAACADPAGPDPAGITGTWNATRIEYVREGTGEAVDAVPLGWTATLVLNGDATFVFTLTPAGEPPQVLSSNWELDGDLLRFVFPGGGVIAWDAVLSGDVLELTGADGAYDFDADGMMDPAKQNITLARAP